MTRTAFSNDKRGSDAKTGIVALRTIFVQAFASRRMLPLWMALAALGLAALPALDHAATGETSAPPEAISGSALVLTARNDEGSAAATERKEETMSNRLTTDQWNRLSSNDWAVRVGDGLGVWVSVKEQAFRVIRGTALLLAVPCSTAAKGSGSKANSYQTPLGWHGVAEKFGEGALWGQVFREKRAANEIWKRGGPVKEDLVLTRVLTLRGEEPGKNKGGDVDSFDRNIYIHGTNDEENIGKPASHGCVRLTNDDVIAAYEIIPLDTPVLITED